MHVCICACVYVCVCACVRVLVRWLELSPSNICIRVHRSSALQLLSTGGLEVSVYDIEPGKVLLTLQV